MSAEHGRLRVLAGGKSADAYDLSEQVGFVLRKANQRHLAIFASRISILRRRSLRLLPSCMRWALPRRTSLASLWPWMRRRSKG